MDALDEYLRANFPAAGKQIEDIYKLVLEVLPVFKAYWDSDRQSWPYEVRTDGAQTETVSSLSASTHSMILFSLASALEKTSQSILLPALKRRLNLDAAAKRLNTGDGVLAGIRDLYREGSTKLVTYLLDRHEKNEAVTYSGTYGEKDPFTLTWICELVRCWESDSDANSQLKAALWVAACECVKRADGDALIWSDGDALEPTLGKRKALDHSFVWLREMHLLKCLQAARGDVDLSYIEQRLASKFSDRLIEQLGYYAIPDSRFDPAEVAFCLEGILIHDHDRLGDKVIERTFDVLSECQEQNPYWRPLYPFIASSRGMVLFPVSVEVANSLLRTCNILDGDKVANTKFQAFAPQLRRYVDWVFARLVRWQNDGNRLAGWHSEHVGEKDTIHLWETSQVLLFLMHYVTMVGEYNARGALVASGLKYESARPLEGGGNAIDWWINEVEAVKEPWIGSPEHSTYRTLKNIRQLYLEPRLTVGKRTKSRSMILFGPPGTGKSGICQDIANALGWRFITVTVSDFLAGGAGEVEARAKNIFRVLEEQANTVILLDEIDHFLLDRTSQLYLSQQGIFQFMTPGMLVKLKDLYERNTSIFVIATNYFERIDSAIKRRGRIDDRLILLPPDKKQREKILDDRLANSELPLASSFSEGVRSDILRETCFFTYGELKQLVAYTAKNVDEATSKDKDGFASELLKAVSQSSPAIRLGDYANKGGEEALEELFLLAYMLAEAEKVPLGPERKVLEDAVKMHLSDQHGDSLREALAKKCRINDAEVCATLAKRLQEWGVAKN